MKDARREMIEERTIYISREDIERVSKGCDLGDSVGVRVYLYPHKDHLHDIIQYDSHPDTAASEEEAKEFVEVAENECISGAQDWLSKLSEFQGGK